MPGVGGRLSAKMGFECTVPVFLRWVGMSDAETPKPESAATAAAEPEEREFPLPPPSFEFLVLSLRLQAEMQLGLLRPAEGDEGPKPNLGGARHAIDLLGVLQEKTKGNLSLEEQRLLENSLTELRFRYVQAVEQSGKAQNK